MEIELKKNYGFELVFKAENVKITEDIEERTYPKKEDGKPDFNKSPKRDICDNAVEQFVNVLEDIIYYREKDFDSSNLIERLFEKLPQESCESLLTKLIRDYQE